MDIQPGTRSRLAQVDHRLAIPAIALLLAALLLFPSPYRDVMLVAVVFAAAVLAWWNVELAWLAALAVLPLLRLGGELFQLNGVTVTRLLVVGLAVIVLARYHAVEKIKALLRSNGLKFFGLFILANLLSALYHRNVVSVSVVLTYLEPLLFFAISYYLVAIGRMTVTRMLGALLIGGALVAVVTGYEVVTQQPVGALLAPQAREMLTVYMSGFDSNRFGLGGRVSSLIAQPVFASLYWVFIPVLLWLYATKSALPKWLVWAAGGVSVFLIILTGTRAGLLALAAAGGILFIFALGTLRQRVWIAAGLVGAALVLGTMLPGLAGYLDASIKLDPRTTATRNIVWRVAVTSGLLDIFRENWLLGYGPGQVQKQSAAGQLARVGGIYPLGGLENQYATILADGGIVAGLAYLVFMLGALADAVRMMRAPPYRAQGVALLALFAAYFVFAATVTTLTEIPNLFLMSVYGALAADFECAPVPQERSAIPSHA